MRPRGFTVVELLIALALMAGLLAALAFGVQASLQTFKENERVADVSQTSRAVLDRIATDVRTAQGLTATTGMLVITPPDNGDGVTQVRYAVASGTLTYTRVTASGQTSYTLLDNTGGVRLHTFSVTPTYGQDAAGVNCIVNVTVHLWMNADGQLHSYTTSAAPRRNQKF